MVGLEQLAKDLHMTQEYLMGESIEIFLKRRLKMIESELFLLAKKYGISNIFEFDRMVSEGRFHEENAFEDYFKFDNLEAERDLILEHLEKL